MHGDLHPGNAARIDGELAYFDWTDACIAHPLIDLHSLQWVDDESVRASLLGAYVEGWGGAVPAAAIELARIVTPLHHAVSYSTIVANVERSGQSEPGRDAHVPARGAGARAGLSDRLDVLDAV